MISTDLMFYFHFKLDNLLWSYYLQLVCVCSRKWFEVFRRVFCSHHMRDVKWVFALYMLYDVFCVERPGVKTYRKMYKEEIRIERGNFEVLWCSISVVSEGFIPSVPCRVIVISLQGPTSTDEVSLTCQSHCSRPKHGLRRSPQGGIPKSPDLQVGKRTFKKKKNWLNTRLC